MGDCLITHAPENGWIESAQGEKLSIGDYVNQLSTINFNCSANSLMEGPTQSLCSEGNFTNPIRDCQFRCNATLISGVTITATSCLLSKVGVRCTDPAKPGTQAHVYCRERYERRSGPTLQITVCGDDGIWSPILKPCTAICGEDTTAGVPLVVGGFQASINEVPWHVVIYKSNGVHEYTFQCGGSIINEQMIVSITIETK